MTTPPDLVCVVIKQKSVVDKGGVVRGTGGRVSAISGGPSGYVHAEIPTDRPISSSIDLTRIEGSVRTNE